MKLDVIVGLFLFIGIESKSTAGTYQVGLWDEEFAPNITNGSVEAYEIKGSSLQKLLESFMKVQQLEALLNQTMAEEEIYKTRAERCETKVEKLNGEVERRTEDMEQQAINIIKKLVTTFNRQRVWRSLRTGLEVVLDPNSTEYGQLQRLGYDQVNPLKKVSEQQGWEALLRMLLRAGLDPDMNMGPYYWTMLHYSTFSYQLSTAELLLHHGAHTEMFNDNRRTPLVLMAVHSNLEGLKLLVERGAYVSSVDKDGRSALHYAVINDHLEMAKFLVNHGALIGLKDMDDKTARELISDNSVGEYLLDFER